MRTISFVFVSAWLLAAQDHVGKPVPDYVTGDECLFCHDRTVGLTWQTNPHAWTIRPAGIAPAVPGTPPAGATHVMGSRPRERWLKLSGYGRFDVFATDRAAWQPDLFSGRCAGCHTTAVDPVTRAFSAFALDCYTCHGVVAPAHSGNTTLVWLSKKHEPAPRSIVSICGQCHLRGGRSRSTGLPYANNFVPGDNLFADFEVDLQRGIEGALNPGDRHVFRNVSDVIGRGSDTTCVTCHRVHGDSSRAHRLQPQSEICLDCHRAGAPKREVTKYEMHSAVCGY